MLDIWKLWSNINVFVNYKHWNLDDITWGLVRARCLELSIAYVIRGWFIDIKCMFCNTNAIEKSHDQDNIFFTERIWYSFRLSMSVRNNLSRKAENMTNGVPFTEKFELCLSTK